MKSLGLLLAISNIALAAPAASTHTLHEKRDVESTRWIKRARIEQHEVLPVRIGLKQQNLENGYDLLMDVSDPESPNYAKHWSPEQVVEHFAPSQETVDSVIAWLHDSGIHSDRITHSDNRGWVAFDATAEETENLMNTEYHLFEHAALGAQSIGCDEYHLPSHIREHVDYITPGIRLLQPRPKDLQRRTFNIAHKSNKAIQPPPVIPILNISIPGLTQIEQLQNCDTAITPVCIATLYNLPYWQDMFDPVLSAAPGNSLGIYEMGSYYSPGDLSAFFGNLSTLIPLSTRPKVVSIDGGVGAVSEQDAGTEADLDLQLAYPIVYPQTITLFSADDAFYNGPNSTSSGAFNTFLDAIDGSYCTYSAYGTGPDNGLDPTYPDPNPGGYKGKLMCGTFKPTSVISISYGGQEDDLPPSYQQRQCNEFMKLGLQGVSIVFASGDNGVAGPPDDGGPNGCLGDNDNIFSPGFPATCPYVTSVGATKLYAGQSVYGPESAANDLAGDPYYLPFSSGGGFSNIYPMPAYQVSSVSRYFNIASPQYPYYSGNQPLGFNGGVYNRSGRGYPDVAANGDNSVLVTNGLLSTSGGTSASTPIFASILNRINSQRIFVGKKPVGFVNPTLYKNPQVLNDIVNGTNPGCGTEGFQTAIGWDPVTGLGTPNYEKMLSLFLSLP